MKTIVSVIVLAGLVMAPICFAEAGCCGRRMVKVRMVMRPCYGNVSACGGTSKCKKYSWTGNVPEWKRLPDDSQFLPREEYAKLKEAMELIPQKVRKQAAKNLKQRAEYLKRPNAERDRNTFITKLGRRSEYQRKKVADEYVLKIYDDMLVFGRPLVLGFTEYELSWLADQYGFVNVSKFVKKVLSTSEKKGRNWRYPMNDQEFKVFSKLARQASVKGWREFENRLLQMNNIYAAKTASCGKKKLGRCGKSL
jgi:hypothetical protein